MGLFIKLISLSSKTLLEIDCYKNSSYFFKIKSKEIKQSDYFSKKCLNSKTSNSYFFSSASTYQGGKKYKLLYSWASKDLSISKNIRRVF